MFISQATEITKLISYCISDFHIPSLVLTHWGTTILDLLSLVIAISTPSASPEPQPFISSNSHHLHCKNHTPVDSKLGFFISVELHEGFLRGTRNNECKATNFPIFFPQKHLPGKHAEVIYNLATAPLTPFLPQLPSPPSTTEKLTQLPFLRWYLALR